MFSLKAYEMLQIDNNTIMIDVRTTEEWQQVGIPNLDKTKLLLLSWRLLPDMVLNRQFKEQLIFHISNIQNNILFNILFLCRSGGRSYEAAHFISSLGYTNCYNVVDGFEGGNNGAGWKQNNLPWQIL